MVTGMTPDAYQVDLNNLPGPGDPGAPIPPDEMDAAIGHRPGKCTYSQTCIEADYYGSKSPKFIISLKRLDLRKSSRNQA